MIVLVGFFDSTLAIVNLLCPDRVVRIRLASVHYARGEFVVDPVTE